MNKNYRIRTGEAVDNTQYLQDEAQYVRNCYSKVLSAERQLSIMRLMYGDDSDEAKEAQDRYDTLYGAYADACNEYDAHAVQMVKDIQTMKKRGMDRKSYEAWMCVYGKFMTLQQSADYMIEQGYFNTNENYNTVHYLLLAVKNLRLYQQILDERKMQELTKNQAQARAEGMTGR